MGLLDARFVPWDRWWARPDSDVWSVSDAWLVPPDGSIHLEGIVRLDDMHEMGCLLLLGEAGSGKSFAVLEAVRRLKSTAAAGNRVHYYDLGLMSDVRDLRETIFEDPAVAAWRDGNGHLTLFLDALDEAKIQIRRVTTVLRQHLGELDLDRLSLRIVCRTADRPAELEQWLKSAFADRFETLELAQLTRSQAAVGAELAGVDAEAFLESVVAAGMAPLAAKPLTLDMLLSLYVAEGGFPERLIELYEQALLRIAGEADAERQGLRKLTSTQSFAVAARIAAATVLAGRDGIEGDPGGGVAVADLVGGEELDRLVGQPTGVVVDEEAIREVLGSGLFSARSGGLGWTHRTFGEYLAAYWLASPRLTDAQVQDLVLVDGGAERQVNPSLRGVVGWLLALRPEFAGHVADADGAVLAYGDPASISPEIRRRLFLSLIEAVWQGDRSVRSRHLAWSRVAYDGADRDLLDVIADAQRDDDARWAAMSAAIEIGVEGIDAVLVEFALDTAAPVRLRAAALAALEKLGPVKGLGRVKPLALSPQPEDHTDELKGAALSLCWPSALTIDEVFGAITDPKKPDAFGAYKQFLLSDFAKGMVDVSDLVRGIDWASSALRESDRGDTKSDMAEAIIAHAWATAPTEPAVAARLGDLVVGLIDEGRALRERMSWRDDWWGPLDFALKHCSSTIAIIDALVRQVATKTVSPDALRRAVLGDLGHYVEPGLIVERWLVATDAERISWIDTLAVLAPRIMDQQLLFDVVAPHEELRAAAFPPGRAVPVPFRGDGDALAQRGREERRYPPDLGEGPDGLTTYVLAKIEQARQGDDDQFRQLQQTLLAGGEGPQGADEAARIASAARWRLLSEETQAAFLDTAAEYLERADPGAPQGPFEDASWRRDKAALVAFELLHDERPQAFKELAGEVWERWAPSLLQGLNTGSTAGRFDQVGLARLRAQVPDLVRRKGMYWLVHGVDGLNKYNINAARRLLGELWDESAEATLLAQLEQGDYDSDEVTDALLALLESGIAQARAWVMDRLTLSVLADVGRADEVALAAGVLWRTEPRTLWEVLQHVVAADPAAGRALLGSVARVARFVGLSSRFDLSEMRELYLLLHRLLPGGPTSIPTQSYADNPEDHAALWRRQILRELVALGTPEAVQVIAGLEREVEDRGQLRRRREQAQEEVRRLAWKPPEPRDVVRMGVDRRRYVQDASALHAMVLEELAAIGRHMRGAYPLAPAIWNSRPYRLPKDENEISNALAGWLRARLGGRAAVVNREIQVNGRTAKDGDRPDVVVQAIGPAAAPLTVVIEVKGAWHEQVLTAMSDQLAARYLKPDLADHGIYLVFWFGPDGWDDYGNAAERTRRGRATRWDIAGLSSVLADQAVEVSSQYGLAVTAVVMDGSLT